MGSGIAAWLTASALARSLPRTTHQIVVVPTHGADDSLGVPMAAETTAPSLPLFHRSIGLEENSLLIAVGGSHTLGIAISDWAQPPDVVFSPYGELGASLGPVSFHHLVQRARAAGNPLKLANFSIAALCAQAQRFSKPSTDPRSVLSALAYGLHLDTAAYRDFMQSDAIAHGVTTVAGNFGSASLDQSGSIEALSTDRSERVEGDLFIDCAGPLRPTASLGDVPFVPLGQWLLCDLVTSSMSLTNEAPLPYASLRAHDSGWHRSITLPQQRCETISFTSAAAPDPATTKLSGYTAGYYAQPWKNNCIALGGAAAIIDPTTSLAVELLRSGIQRLLSLLPRERHCTIEAAEYNRQATAEFECARDFAILPYKLNARRGQPFWDHCRHMPIPDSLAHRIEVYQSCGRVTLHDGEVVGMIDWLVMLDAQATAPRQYDVVARGIPLSAIDEHLARVRTVMLESVATLPSYADYLTHLHAATATSRPPGHP